MMSVTSGSISSHCRTVVVTGVPDLLPGSRMNDKLTIHFQSKRSCGGDVEYVKFPTHLKGVAFVTFDNWQDAERVVECRHVLKDREFPAEYPLTVYKFSPEVNFYAYADVDLSHFPDLSSLIASLRSTHRCIQVVKSLTKPGIVSVEGPFSALQDLRQDLQNRCQSSGGTQPSLDEAVDEKKETEDTDSVLLWLDTHIYTYMQKVERKEWDRCLSRYNVTAQALSTDDVTQVQLSGKCGAAALYSAQAELEKLVAERQGTLRTQHLDCADPGLRKTLLKACEDAQLIYTDVCYVLTSSCIEIIGPSISSHLFCDYVKHSSRWTERQRAELLKHLNTTHSSLP